jgi:hypothetical protein
MNRSTTFLFQTVVSLFLAIVFIHIVSSVRRDSAMAIHSRRTGKKAKIPTFNDALRQARLRRFLVSRTEMFFQNVRFEVRRMIIENYCICINKIIAFIHSISTVFWHRGNKNSFLFERSSVLYFPFKIIPPFQCLNY